MLNISGLTRAFPVEVVMQKSITVLLTAGLLAAGSALAQSDIKLADNAPDRYIVEKGDTLWSIAQRFLKEPWRWPEIWRMNQDQVKNPHRISPGMVLALDRGKQQLQVAQTTMKLSPQVRAETLPPSDAIPAIPPNLIEPFLTEPLVIEEGGLSKAPRIVATEENRVNLGPGNIAYVNGVANSKSEVWQVYRPGRPLVDPDSNRTLGYEAIYLGTGKLVRRGDPSTLQIVASKQEISAGDRLIPAGAPVVNQYMPHAPSSMIRGRIIGMYGRLASSEGGRNSVVSINRGSRDGMETGHVLAIYRHGATVPDPAATVSRDRAPRIGLPDERYGLIFIFRTFNSVSYALVMESSRPVAPGDVVRSP